MAGVSMGGSRVYISYMIANIGNYICTKFCANLNNSSDMWSLALTITHDVFIQSSVKSWDSVAYGAPALQRHNQAKILKISVF